MVLILGFSQTTARYGGESRERSPAVAGLYFFRQSLEESLEPRIVVTMMPAAKTTPAQMAPPVSCGGLPGQISGVVHEFSSAYSATTM